MNLHSIHSYLEEVLDWGKNLSSHFSEIQQGMKDWVGDGRFQQWQTEIQQFNEDISRFIEQLPNREIEKNEVLNHVENIKIKSYQLYQDWLQFFILHCKSNIKHRPLRQRINPIQNSKQKTVHLH